jgi:alpha-glucosidase (family GH31 glycosyl hydrolase)
MACESGSVFRLDSGEAVAIGTEGLAPSFLLGAERRLGTEEAAPFSLGFAGFELRPTGLVGSSASGGRIELSYATEDPEVSVSLSVTPEQGCLLVELEASGSRQIARIGFNFESAVGESWFGAEVLASSSWPLDSCEIERHPFLASDNQASPIWISSSGAAIYLSGYQLLGFHFNRRGKGSFGLYAIDSPKLSFRLAMRRDAREAFLAAMRGVGLAGALPPYEYFAKPSFCTWISFLKGVSQEGIGAYLAEMEASGFSCGVFTIDDKWTPAYGDLRFDAGKFPDPAGLVQSLHARGAKVALWVTPFVDEDSERFAEALEKGYLIGTEGGPEPYFARWWNGRSAMVDLSLPEARQWFLDGLRALAAECGADGYKLDAGDGRFLGPGCRSARPMNALEYADAFASLGAEFEVNELRVSWLSQGLGLVQRLRDKAPSWSRFDGLASIIPHGLTLGLLGYPFFCADMIGGGWDERFIEAGGVDEELFVRWTEASALLPIMQFSYAPWKLAPEARAICLRYAKLHESFAPYIYERARVAAKTGLPIAAPLFLAFPGEAETFAVGDQFMLGDRYLVAPVLEKGALARDLYLPKGSWLRMGCGVPAKGEGVPIEGGAWLRSVPAALDELPVFELIGAE